MLFKKDEAGSNIEVWEHDYRYACCSLGVSFDGMRRATVFGSDACHVHACISSL